MKNFISFLLKTTFILILVLVFQNNTTYAFSPSDFGVVDLKFSDFHIENKLSDVEKEMLVDAFTLYSMGKRVDAVNLCTKGIARFPSRPTFYIFRAYFNMLIKDSQDAYYYGGKLELNDLSKAISLDPNFTFYAYYFRAWCYLKNINYRQLSVDKNYLNTINLNINNANLDINKFYDEGTKFAKSIGEDYYNKIAYMYCHLAINCIDRRLYSEQLKMKMNSNYLPQYDYIKKQYNTMVALVQQYNSYDQRLNPLLTNGKDIQTLLIKIKKY